MAYNREREIADLERQLEENPYNVRALSELARVNAIRADYTAACQNYERIVRMDEQNGKAWTALGHCYLLKGEYQKCFTAYQKALHLVHASKDAQLWYGIGLLYNKFDSLEYAESAFQTVLRIFPQFDHRQEVLFKLGLIYKKTGNYEKAIQYFKESQNHEEPPISRKIDLDCHIGVCYQKLEQLDIAIAFFNEALNLDESNFKVYQYLAWAHTLNQDYGTALQYLETAKDLTKENCAELGDIHYLMGRIYLIQDEYPDGQAAFQRAIYKNPNAYVYWCSIGILYAIVRQATDAFECFVRASNLVSDRVEVWYNMGVLYEHCEQHHEAKLAYQRATEIDFDFMDAANRIQLIEAGTNLENMPEYKHPDFEIGEFPFSLIQNEKVARPLKPLPNMQSDFAEEDENGKKPNSLSINLRELIRPDFENFLNENSQNDTSLIQPEEIFLPPKELAVEEPNEKYEIQPVEPEPVMPQTVAPQPVKAEPIIQKPVQIEPQLDQDDDEIYQPPSSQQPKRQIKYTTRAQDNPKPPIYSTRQSEIKDNYRQRPTRDQVIEEPAAKYEPPIKVEPSKPQEIKPEPKTEIIEQPQIAQFPPQMAQAQAQQGQMPQGQMPQGQMFQGQMPQGMPYMPQMFQQGQAPTQQPQIIGQQPQGQGYQQNPLGFMMFPAGFQQQQQQHQQQGHSQAQQPMQQYPQGMMGMQMQGVPMPMPPYQQGMPPFQMMPGFPYPDPRMMMGQQNPMMSMMYHQFNPMAMMHQMKAVSQMRSQFGAQQGQPQIPTKIQREDSSGTGSEEDEDEYQPPKKRTSKMNSRASSARKKRR